MSSAYLLRFDDVCPTLNWEIWDRLEPLLLEAGVKPLMAVIPDNHDEHLMAGPANKRFWDRVRGWQGNGWSIGLHGYQHRYTSYHAGLIGWRAESEFAGETEQDQERKLDLGLDEFRNHGISADAWVAPGHTFDQTTLRVLRARGMWVISDGFSRYPYVDADGMVWVPQQLWRFRKMPPGIWTICLHVNPWDTSCLETFSRNLDRFRGQISSLTQVLEHYHDRRLSFTDRVFAALWSRLISLRSADHNDAAPNVAS